MTEPTVLITIQNGTVDYVTQGGARVVCVDFDSLDPETSFPEDVDVIIEKVVDLPSKFPWRGAVVRRLNEVKKQCKAALTSGPVYEDDPPPPCCDYRDHGSGACACPDHDYSPLHPFGTPHEVPGSDAR